MTTILGDDYDPVEVLPLDLVGYLGDKGFVILSSVKNRNRKLPSVEGSVLEFVPLCIRAKVVNNQVVNFSGQVATLHDIDGVWHYRLRREGMGLVKLEPHIFFEIGDTR